MKSVEILVVFSISIHFAYTSSVAFVSNEAAIDAVAEIEDKSFETNDEETFAADESNFGVEIWQSRQCFPGECNAHCRRLGHARGVCLGNLCQCRLRSSPVADFTKGDLQEYKTENRIGCNILSCMDLCRRLGFRYFRCDFTRCVCWNQN